MKKLLALGVLHAVRLNISAICYVASVVIPDGVVVSMLDYVASVVIPDGVVEIKKD